MFPNVDTMFVMPFLKQEQLKARAKAIQKLHAKKATALQEAFVKRL